MYSNETYSENFHEYLLTGKDIVIFINVLKLVSKINILFKTNFDVIFHNTATIRSISLMLKSQCMEFHLIFNDYCLRHAILFSDFSEVRMQCTSSK